MDTPINSLEIPLERDLFLRNLIRELTGVLEDVVGLEEASGFISIVGQNIGRSINDSYKQALKINHLEKEQVVAVLEDLKRRINGDFYIIEAGENKVVLGNRVCPFTHQVVERQSLCMMTSNVFGVITAENLGYSKVALENTIAEGDPECRIVVYFNEPATHIEGREYYRD